MNSLPFLLNVGLLLFTAFVGYLTWQQDPGRRRARITYFVIAGLTTALSAVLMYSEDKEKTRRFEETVIRLRNVALQLGDLSESNERLLLTSIQVADSLHRVLTVSDSLVEQQEDQLIHQYQGLTLLTAGLDSQQVQLTEQRAISRSQRELLGNVIRERYPLQLPFSVWGTLEYPAEVPAVGAWIDSLYADARYRLARADWRAQLQARRGPWLPEDIWVTRLNQYDDLFVRESGSAAPEPVAVRFRQLPDQEDLSSMPTLLKFVYISGSLSSRRPLGFEVRFSGQTGLPPSLTHHPTERRSPVWELYTTVDFERRLVLQEFVINAVTILHQTSALSLLDLHCSTLDVTRRLPTGDAADPPGRFTAFGLGFGPWERYREIQLDSTRLRREKANQAIADLNLSDLFPAGAQMFAGQRVTLAESDLAPDVLGTCQPA